MRISWKTPIASSSVSATLAREERSDGSIVKVSHDTLVSRITTAHNDNALQTRNQYMQQHLCSSLRTKFRKK